MDGQLNMDAGTRLWLARRRAYRMPGAVSATGKPATMGSSATEETSQGQALDILAPLGGQLSFGSLLGFAAGTSLRFFGRVAAVGVGSTFCVVQALAYRGYLEVNWSRVHQDFVEKLDRDKDGKVTTSDLAIMWQELESCLTFNLPAGCGFTAGLVYGLGMKATTSAGVGALAGVGARVVLPRAMLGGAGSIGGSTGFAHLEGLWSGRGRQEPAAALASRPGYCIPHILGEPEERCSWSQEVFASSRRQNKTVAPVE
eukprot:gnl/TRDRNA2_/TRDRNA2_193666_c0_seq1.p1 gnl/TRDRNA2_/TRDRNA2_193666_c0~~gnl/TRDRNA2_/TRDRNA2_193666_c0_seq1.p1  ORF type:complete len:257 (+),score=38.91 gnl/TRDRNA2_/TRDRNA2_193666_c0_seq1:56-826(+)